MSTMPSDSVDTRIGQQIPRLGSRYPDWAAERVAAPPKEKDSTLERERVEEGRIPAGRC